VIIHALKCGNDIGQLPNQLRGQILVQQDAHGLAVAVGDIGHLCCKRADRGGVFFLEAGMFVKDFLLRHPVGEPAQNVVDRDPHAADAWVPVPFVGLDRDARVLGRDNSIMAQRSAGVLCCRPTPLGALL
jgi:hypothetical protein